MKDYMKQGKGFILILVVVSCIFYVDLFAVYKEPYNVNIWDAPVESQDLLRDAGIGRCRMFVRWNIGEPQNLPAGSDQYNYWYPMNGVQIYQRTGIKICMCFLDPPQWAWDLGYDAMIQEATIFVLDMLKYYDNVAPGCVDMIDLGNEMNIWYGEDMKDPSVYYADLFKTIYAAVKEYNPNILVMPTAMFIRFGELEEDFLDQLYQLGCQFDRINFHMYLRDYRPEGGHYEETDPIRPSNEPWYTEFNKHYPTRIRYMKYVAEQNGDNDILIINGEYGWKCMSRYEDLKSDYYKYILDVSRESGFCDTTFMYPGTWHGYTVDSTTTTDTAALIYTDEMLGNANLVMLTTSYYMYKSYHEQYPDWDPSQRQSLQVLPGASQDANITNPGFESGTTGWTGATLDTSVRHSGSNSGRSSMGTIRTDDFTVEPDRLYEMIYWIKVSGSGHVWRHYDTSKYPGGWKRFRQIILTSPSDTAWSLTFTGTGSGIFWVDDVSFNALDLSDPPVIPGNTAPSVATNLLCNGQVDPGSLKDFNPELSWIFNDPDPGDVESAYQVIVADNMIDINNNNGNLWNTGKVETVAVKIKYAGTSLDPGTYYWKVKTWDYNDAEASYSNVATFTISPIITVTSPNGGELWSVGTQQTITWTSRGIISNLNIDLSTDGGNNWTSLGSGVPNDGSESITVPNSSSMDCKIRIEETDGDPTDTSDTNFVISTGGINTALRFDETDDGLNFGSDSSLDVNSGNAAGLTIEMWVKMDNNTGWREMLSRGVWQVGGYSLNLWDNYIRFSITTAAGDIMFEDNTARLIVGKWHHVAVVAEGTTGKIFIDGDLVATKTDFGMPASASASAYINPFGGTMDELRISNIARYSDSFTLPTEPFTVDSNTMGLWHFDEGIGTATADEKGINNATFVGDPQWVLGYFVGGQVGASITLTSPNGGQTWTPGTTETVTWNYTGVVNNVNIDLSTDGSQSWTTLVANTENDGVQAITVPDSPSTNCWIRVQEPDGDPTDMSNSNFTIEGEAQGPIISINLETLDFGNVEIGEKGTLDFVITNTGGGTLSGTITTDKKWIEVTPTSFEDNTVIVDVKVDNNILYQNAGLYTGKVTITSNGGDAEVTVELTATCVLGKPNPYDPSKGDLKFFGNGIVPGKTTINIYTLSGELVKKLGPEDRDVEQSEILLWRGKNEKGKEVMNGIYIYIYESPKEKGVGKITVIRQ